MTIASLAAMGGTEEARLIVARFLELRPNYSVGARVGQLPFWDAAQRERCGRHLVAAGVPE